MVPSSESRSSLRAKELTYPMCRRTRYLLIPACLLLLTAVVPPQPALGNGDPDEVIEKTEPFPPLPPFQIPPSSPPAHGFQGDPDELPDGGYDDEGGSGGPTLPGDSGMRGTGDWIFMMLNVMRLAFSAAY